MRIGLRATPDIDVLQQLIDRLLDTIEIGHLVVHAVATALGRGTVVAVDENDKRIVEFAHVFDGTNNATDLVVGHLDIAGEHFGLPGEKRLLVVR